MLDCGEKGLQNLEKSIKNVAKSELAEVFMLIKLG